MDLAKKWAEYEVFITRQRKSSGTEQLILDNIRTQNKIDNELEKCIDTKDLTWGTFPPIKVFLVEPSHVVVVNYEPEQGYTRIRLVEIIK